MPFVLSLACTQMKMSPAEAITTATYNGACALDCRIAKGALSRAKMLIWQCSMLKIIGRLPTGLPGTAVLKWWWRGKLLDWGRDDEIQSVYE